MLRTIRNLQTRSRPLTHARFRFSTTTILRPTVSPVVDLLKTPPLSLLEVQCCTNSCMVVHVSGGEVPLPRERETPCWNTEMKRDVTDVCFFFALRGLPAEVTKKKHSECVNSIDGG